MRPNGMPMASKSSVASANSAGEKYLLLMVPILLGGEGSAWLLGDAFGPGCRTTCRAAARLARFAASIRIAVPATFDCVCWNWPEKESRLVVPQPRDHCGALVRYGCIDS